MDFLKHVNQWVNYITMGTVMKNNENHAFKEKEYIGDFTVEGDETVRRSNEKYHYISEQHVVVIWMCLRTFQCIREMPRNV